MVTSTPLPVGHRHLARRVGADQVHGDEVVGPARDRHAVAAVAGDHVRELEADVDLGLVAGRAARRPNTIPTTALP